MISKSSKVFIFQNAHDKAHLKKHLKPFLESVPNNDVCVSDYCEDGSPHVKKLNVIYYNDESSGHSPPGKDVTVNMIRFVSSLPRG